MISSFWCSNCKKDLDLPALKSSLLTGEEYFWALCNNGKCRRKLIRRITDRKNDPYFRVSKKVRMEMEELKIDLIQPSNPKFQMYYKNQWDKMEQDAEKYEQEQIRKKQERENWYRDNKLNHRGAAKKVVELEEQMQYGG